MAKQKWTERKIADRTKAGNGRGTGSSYKPWLTVRDFSSLGRTWRTFSPKFGRNHTFFSDLEHNVFLWLEWSKHIIDVWEQYPLERQETIPIAGRL